MIRKLFSAFIIRSFTLTLIFAMLLSGCSNSLFLPISEDATVVVEPMVPTYSTEITLDGVDLYSEYNGSMLTIYSNTKTLNLELTVTAVEQNWSEYKIWQGDEPADTEFISIDFAGGDTAAFPYNLDATVDDSYPVNIKLRNAEGEISDQVTVIVKLDRVAPDYDLMINGSTGDTSTSSTSTSIQFYNKSATDFRLMKVWKKSEGETESSSEYRTFSETDDVTIAANEAAEYYFGTKIMDKAGNESLEITTPTLTYTTASPTFNFSINSTLESATNTRVRTLDIITSNVVLPAPDAVSIAIWDSSETMPGEGYFNKSTDQFTHTLPISNDDYTVNVRLRQGDSNYSTVMSRMIRFDNTVPEISGFLINGSDSPENTNNPTLSVSLTASDNLAETSELEAKIWEGAEEDEPADSYYQSLEDIATLTVSAERTYTYWAMIRDDSGNKSLTSSCQITYDTTDPVVSSFVCNDGTITRNSDTTLALTVSDDVVAYKLWEGDSEPATIEANLTDWTNGSGDIPYTFSGGDDTYDIHIRVYDEAGNESDRSDISVIYDVTDPTLSFVINDSDSKTNSSSVTLTVTAPTDVTMYKIWEGDNEASAIYKTYPMREPPLRMCSTRSPPMPMVLFPQSI